MSDTAHQGSERSSSEAADEAAVLARSRARRRPRRKRSVTRWCVRGAFVGAIGVVVLAAALLSALYLMLAKGPIATDMLGSRIAAAIDARVGPEYDVTVGRTTIESGQHGPFIAVADLRVITISGEPVLTAPRATVSLDPYRLLMGQIAPRRIELFDLELQLALSAGGEVAVSAGAQPFLRGRAPTAAPGSIVAPPPVGEDAAVRALGDALRRTLAVAIGSNSLLGTLEHVGVSNARLLVDDRAQGRKIVFDDLELGIDKQNEAALLTIAATGPSGRWSIAAQALGESGDDGRGPRSLDVELRDISMDEVALVLNLRAPPVDFDTPISARLQLGMDEDGRLTTADGRFAVGSGFIYFRDPDQEPLRVDEITGRLNWDASARRFDVGPVNFHSGGTHLTFGGRIEPPEENARAWRFDLASAPGSLGGSRPGEKDVYIETSRLTLLVDPQAQSIQFERFDLGGPDLSLALTGELRWTEGARQLRAQVTATNTAVQAALRVWPSVVAAQTRAWFLAHRTAGKIESGRINISLDEDAMIALAEHRAISEGAVNIEGVIQNGELAFMPGVPALSGVAGALQVTGRKATFVASAGYMETAPERRLSLVEGRFESGEFGTGVVKGQVNVRASGSLDAVTDLISAEGMKPFGGFQVERGLVRGQVDGRVVVDLFMEPTRQPAVRVSTQITNMVVERVMGRERLDQGNITVTADATGVRATGQGRLMGNQVKIDLRKTPGAPTEATLTTALDEATRAKNNWNAPGVTGTVGVKVTTLLGVGDKAKPAVELDLTRAAIASIGGYTKPAGRAAKASFTLQQEPQQITLQAFSFEGGAAAAQGVIELDGAGGFTSASLSQLKLSPGDDMKAEISQTKDGGYRAQVRGASMDARPFIQDLFGGKGESSQSPPLDLDLKSNLITGANGQALSNVDLKVVTRGDNLREFRLSARAGRSALTGGALQAQPGAPQQFFIRTDDGGALLSFLDLYRRMDGGQLQLVGFGNSRSSNGSLSVRNFTLRNEATLEKLVAEGARGREANVPIDPNAVQFDRLAVAFSRSGGRLDLRDGVVSGPSVGATIEGAIDFTRDQVALNGTFVPAYGLNNMFSRIPLFGPLLGGGANEGLIGINFRVAGPASAPLLTINPLSAMTPGFLRKIFGAADAVTLPPQSFPAQGQPAARPQMPLSISPR